MAKRKQPHAAMAAIEIAGEQIRPGERRKIELDCARLPTRTQLEIPVMVVNGRRPGPRLWVSAAIHGDEINGVEIIREVLEAVEENDLVGTFIALPIVNVFGFVHSSRYLPDRRDLNRCFPGSTGGSLASRIARLFLTEIVEKCTHGIDLHTGSSQRSNHPQIRADLDDAETRRCALAFGAPAMIHARTRDGSLREAAANRGIPTLLYEGGEPGRFNDFAIGAGVRGVLGVMRELGMRKSRKEKPGKPPLEIRKTSWVRAKAAGIFRVEISEGEVVDKGQRVGTIADAFGEKPQEICAPFRGLVIGMTNNPLVYRGDALINLGRLRR